jgi:ABC-type molybdate transport system substrate-binding protein
MSDKIVAGDGKALAILSASAVREALVDCANLFARAKGFGTTLEFDTSGGILKRVAAGERRDVFASALEPLKDLAARGLIGAPVAIGVSRIALGVRKGDKVPDISTVEKFKRVLLEAPAFARGDPAGGGTAGNHLHDVLVKLGMLDAVRDTSILRVGGYKVMAEVAAGRAAFGLTQGTEIAAVEGVEIGTWLPPEIQLVTTYGVAPGKTPRDPAIVAAFFDFITKGEGAGAFARAGFSPP